MEERIDRVSSMRLEVKIAQEMHVEEFLYMLKEKFEADVKNFHIEKIVVSNCEILPKAFVCLVKSRNTPRMKPTLELTYDDMSFTSRKNGKKVRYDVALGSDSLVFDWDHGEKKFMATIGKAKASIPEKAQKSPPIAWPQAVKKIKTSCHSIGASSATKSSTTGGFSPFMKSVKILQEPEEEGTISTEILNDLGNLSRPHTANQSLIEEFRKREEDLKRREDEIKRKEEEWAEIWKEILKERAEDRETRKNLKELLESVINFSPESIRCEASKENNEIKMKEAVAGAAAKQEEDGNLEFQEQLFESEDGKNGALINPWDEELKIPSLEGNQQLEEEEEENEVKKINIRKDKVSDDANKFIKRIKELENKVKFLEEKYLLTNADLNAVIDHWGDLIGSPVKIYNTQCFEMLIKYRKNETEAKKRAGINKRLHPEEFALFPIKYSPQKHWALLLWKRRTGELFYLDSLDCTLDNKRLQGSKEACELLQKISSEESKMQKITPSFHDVKIPHQTNAEDCGFIVLTMMKMLRKENGAFINALRPHNCSYLYVHWFCPDDEVHSMRRFGNLQKKDARRK